MSDPAGLERRYRRLLAFYPRSFQRENEQEAMILVLGPSSGPYYRQEPAQPEPAQW